MAFRWQAALVGAALAALPGPADAQREISVTFGGLRVGTAYRVNDLGADQANRVWVATDAGVSALVGDQLAPFFPFRTFDGLIDDDVRAVAFGELGGEENFFLGFTNGVQFGRVLSETGISLPLDSTLLTGDAAQDNIAELASDRTQRVWAATLGGLVAWNITGERPTLDDVFLDGEPVNHAAVAPWEGDPAVVFSSGARLYLTRAGTPNAIQLRVPATFRSTAALAFDPSGDLWVVEGSADPRQGSVLLRYAGGDLGGTSPTTVDPVSSPGVAQRSMRGLTVAPFDGTLWVATNQGAYFQTPGADGSLTAEGWTVFDATPSIVNKRVDAVLADPAGNLWFGTEDGIRGVLERLLTLDGTRYLGNGAQATISLEDIPGFADNGQTGEVITVESGALQVSVGGTARALAATEQGDTGKFGLSFRFLIGETPPDLPAGSTDFYVQSSAEGVPVDVSYRFAPDLTPLHALASWANVVPFEDDIIVGGPCFLELLGR